MDDSSLPVSNIPGWMQIGVSFAVFMFATMGAIWGYVNRQAKGSNLTSVGGGGGEDATAVLNRIETLIEKIVEQQMHNVNVIEKLLFLLELRQKNEDLDRVVGDTIHRSLPDLARMLREQRDREKS
jgi:hypothetical protein